MLSMPGYTYRGAGTIDNLTFFAGSNEYPVREIKAQWLDKLTPEQRATELKKFPANYDFDQDGRIGYNRIFVFDNVRKRYLGYAEFFFDTVRRFQTVTHPDGSKGLYWFGCPVGCWITALISCPTRALKNSVSSAISVNFRWATPSTLSAVPGITPRVSRPPCWLAPDNGYSTDEPVVYQAVMKYTDYDPDPVGGKGAKMAANAFFGDYLYFVAANAFFGDYLYFGSYHQGTSGAYDKIMHKYCDQAQIEKLCKLTE
jgi:hypothetical protein